MYDSHCLDILEALVVHRGVRTFVSFDPSLLSITRTQEPGACGPSYASLLYLYYCHRPLRMHILIMQGDLAKLNISQYHNPDRKGGLSIMEAKAFICRTYHLV